MLLLALAGIALAGTPAWADTAAERGHALFTAKHCARCHRPAGQQGVGPALEKLARPQGAFELAGRLFNHAPAMFAALKQEGVDWPQISPAEMGDLMAFLKAEPARDPPPDLFQGQAVLVRKGCLKCHSLQREGGRVGPDLGERRPAYESATAWAAAMWIHSPAMAAKALEMGILYPRFDADELNNLVGFLRSVAR
jgi:cytochrome c551/c552